MPCRREIASRYAASARSRCTSVRRGRAAIPRPAKPWRFPASTFLTSSPARICANASTMARIGPSEIEGNGDIPHLLANGDAPHSGVAISSPAFLDLEPWVPGAFEFSTALPGSKSLTLRDCAIAALAAGTSTIHYPGEADDYWRMKDCLRRLGIVVDDSQPDVVTVAGRGGEFAPGRVELDVGQSAVTTRLMLACAALRPDVTVVDGHVSMRNRPNKDLVDALRTLGATLESSNDGHLPITVRGTRELRGPVR